MSSHFFRFSFCFVFFFFVVVVLGQARALRARPARSLSHGDPPPLLGQEEASSKRNACCKRLLWVYNNTAATRVASRFEKFEAPEKRGNGRTIGAKTRSKLVVTNRGQAYNNINTLVFFFGFPPWLAPAQGTSP